MTMVKHDGDGKIYAEEKFLFEVQIREGDEVAKRINALLDTADTTALKKAFVAGRQSKVNDEGFDVAWILYVNAER